MAKKYELEVNFALPQHIIRGMTLEGVQPGGMLEGEIILTPFEEVNCRGVWLEIGYREGGNGTPYEDRLLETMICKGRLHANESFSHHLLYQLPDNVPISYTGDYVKIEWYIRIRIDIPFWFDTREEFPFRVIPRILRSRNEIDTI
ncbi:MAG: hypothetical protein K8T10_02570 [Candidatus Eremiobacteraeota bacterium]|nr:hypothetical protein [Candidatus Eremiobacteraeota bacterium]